MKLDLNALIEDVQLARVTLFNQHCKAADDVPEAALALASQLQHQARIVLAALYGSDEKAARHIRLTAGAQS